MPAPIPFYGFGGDTGGPTQAYANPYEAALAQALTYNAYFPGETNTTINAVGQAGQSLQDINQSLAPQNQALQNKLFGQYAPQLYQTGNLLNQIALSGGVDNASNLLAGKGGQLLKQAIAADQLTNPQFYAARESAGNGINRLLTSATNAIPANGSALSGSEQADVERTLNQQDAARGLLNSPSQTATVANAMNFGRAGQAALQQKQNSLSQAIQTASSFLPSSQSSINSFNVGTGAATNQANPGANQFQGVAGSQANNVLGPVFGAGNSLAGTTGDIANTQMTNATNAPSRLDKSVTYAKGGTYAADDITSF